MRCGRNVRERRRRPRRPACTTLRLALKRSAGPLPRTAGRPARRFEARGRPRPVRPSSCGGGIRTAATSGRRHRPTGSKAGDCAPTRAYARWGGIPCGLAWVGLPEPHVYLSTAPKSIAVRRGFNAANRAARRTGALLAPAPIRRGELNGHQSFNPPRRQPASRRGAGRPASPRTRHRRGRGRRPARREPAPRRPARRSYGPGGRPRAGGPSRSPHGRGPDTTRIPSPRTR